MTILKLEELSTPQLDALDRERTVVILTVSPLETHGPHLPLGVDAFTARHFAEAVAERVVAARPGWSAVLAPTLHLGSFTFDTVGTVSVRQRVVRDAVVIAVPSAPLCTPDCAGLCPGCGGKWAELGPEHAHETIDPRWAALQERFPRDQGH